MIDIACHKRYSSGELELILFLRLSLERDLLFG